MSTEKPLNIVFIIDRLTNYRMFSSLIAEGCQRGLPIQCWHLCENKRKSGDKGYLYPSLDKARFKENDYPTLTLRAFESKNAMAEALATKNDISHVVSMEPAETLATQEQLARFTSTWCVIMYGQDTFKNLSIFKDGSPGSGVKTIFFAYTRYLFDFGMAFVDRYLNKANTYLQRPNVSIRFIGNTMLDPCVQHIDNDAVRKKHGIPPGKNIAIYLPYGYLPAKKFKRSRAWQAAFSSLHIERISKKEFNADGFINESMLKRFNRKLNLTGKALRDPVAREWLVKGWHEPAVIDNVRRFCDKNNLLLVVKPRRKFDFSEAVYKKADVIVEDNESQYYPSMMQELLSIASIGISFFSWSVLEFIYQGVPIINLECLDDRVENPEKKYWHSTEDGFIYAFKHNVWNYTVPDFIQNFSSRTLDNFSINEDQRASYFDRFLGDMNHSAAELFFDSLEKENA